MVKNYLAKHETNIGYNTNDQMRLKFRCVPNVFFFFSDMILNILRNSHLQVFKKESVMMIFNTHMWDT